MKDKKTLDELARDLSPRERDELLEKIKNSFDFIATEAENLFEADDPVEEKTLAKVQAEIDHLSFWRRLLLKISSFFFGLKQEDYFIRRKLKKIQHSIESHQPSFADFTHNEATPKLADAFFDLYSHSLPLHRIIETSWKNHSFMLDALTYLLKEEMNHVKEKLDDFLSFNEMVNIYSESNDKGEIRKIVLKRMNDYLKAISQESFDSIEEAVLPFLYLKYIVLFPYKSFFSFFKVSINELSPGEYPPFQRCSLKVIVDFLERMEYAFHLLNEMDWSEDKFEAPLRCYLMQEEQLQEDALEKKLDGLLRDIETLGQAKAAFEKKLSLSELIKGANQDPYYSMVYYYPRINIRNFYNAALKIRLLSEVDGKISVIKREVVRRSVGSIFENYQLTEMIHYRPNRPNENLPQAMPAFQHTESVKLMYNFCTWYFNQKVQPIINYVGNQILSRNQLMQNKLIQSAGDVQETANRFKQLDRSLAPESDSGKNYNVLRYSASSSRVQMQQYRTIIIQTDQEALDVIKKGMEVLERLQRFLKSILASPQESVQVQLRSIQRRLNQNQTMADILKNLVEDIRHFRNMVNQVVDMEKGK